MLLILYLVVPNVVIINIYFNFKDPAADTANRKYYTMNKATSLKNISAQSANSGSNKTLRFFGDTDADESISKAKGKK